MRHCPYCNSTDIESTFSGGFRCYGCGEEFQPMDDRDEMIIDGLHDLLDKIAGPLDDEARVSALDDLIQHATIMRAELEGDYGME